MEHIPATLLNVCPVCSTPVEGERIAGLWTGCIATKAGKKIGASGPGYVATCKKCGAHLEATVTREEAAAREFYWYLKEPPHERRKSWEDEKREQKSVLEPLLLNQEKREQVVKSLALDFIDYSEGSDRRPELRKWLFFDEVAVAEKQFPGILAHMGPLTMTWLFFDREERLQGYFIRSR